MARTSFLLRIRERRLGAFSPKAPVRAHGGLGPFAVCLAFLAGLIGLFPAPARAAAPEGAQAPKAYISLVIDDYKNLGVWETLAEDCAAKGVRATLALNTLRVRPEDWKRLQARIAQGHEVASHTRDHVPLSAEEVLNVRYFAPNTRSATAVVDAAARKLRLFVNGAPTPIGDIDLSAAGPASTLGDLARAINKINGCAAQPIDPKYANIPSELLAANPGADILFKAGFVPLLLDHPRFVRYELEASKREIEKNIPGYTCTSIVYPYLANDPETRRIAQELGYTQGRTGENGSISLTDPKGYDIMRIWAQMPRFLFGETSSPEFPGRVKAFVSDLKNKHGAVCIYAHAENEYSNEDWRKLVALLTADPEVRLLTLREMAKAIRGVTVPGAGGMLHFKR